MKYKTVVFRRGIQIKDLNEKGSEGWCLYEIQYDARKGEHTARFKRSSGTYTVTYHTIVAHTMSDSEKEDLWNDRRWVYSAMDPVELVGGFIHYFYEVVR